MMIDPNQDELSFFANWYLTTSEIKRFHTPFRDPLLFIEGVSGVVLYRKQYFQVELFICAPNTIIPEHTHPDVDSYEVFLYGMQFTHNGTMAISMTQAMQETQGMPSHAYESLRVKPTDLHGGTASPTGGAFISIQKWLHGVTPSHVSSNWDGHTMGDNHRKQIGS